MKIIGLTGPSGSGKTTISQVARKLGYFVIDCDKVAKEVSNKGEILEKLKKTFGNVVVNGVLDRKGLAAKAFASPENTKKLNNIMLDVISKEIEDIIKRAKQDGVKEFLLDAPTLYESKMDKKCHKVIAVLADEKTREKRLLLRDNLTRAQLKDRMRASKPDEFYLEKTGYIIYNNEDEAAAKETAEKMLKSF